MRRALGLGGLLQHAETPQGCSRPFIFARTLCTISSAQPSKTSLKVTPVRTQTWANSLKVVGVKFPSLVRLPPPTPCQAKTGDSACTPLKRPQKEHTIAHTMVEFSAVKLDRNRGAAAAMPRDLGLRRKFWPDQAKGRGGKLQL